MTLPGELSSDGGPTRKEGCRMITYKDQVLVVGGRYEPGEVFQSSLDQDMDQ